MVELLVVIAIIAILAGMLLPGLARSKAQTKTILCINGLRQMSIATRLYAEDYGDRVPPAFGPSGEYWFHRLAPYMGEPTVKSKPQEKPSGLMRLMIPLHSPPLLSHTSSAIAMHDKFWRPIGTKLRDDALVLLNDATFETEVDTERYRVIRVPATDRATDLGHPMGGSLVMAGAYAAISGVVSLDSLLAGMRESIPSYRTQHIEANVLTLTDGFEWGSRKLATMGARA